MGNKTRLGCFYGHVEPERGCDRCATLAHQIVGFSIGTLSLVPWIVTLVPVGVNFVQQIESFSIRPLNLVLRGVSLVLQIVSFSIHTLSLVLRIVTLIPCGMSFVLQIVSFSIHTLSLLKWIVTLIPCGMELVLQIVSFSIHTLSFSIWTQRLKERTQSFIPRLEIGTRWIESLTICSTSDMRCSTRLKAWIESFTPCCTSQTPAV